MYEHIGQMFDHKIELDILFEDNISRSTYYQVHIDYVSDATINTYHHAAFASFGPPKIVLGNDVHAINVKIYNASQNLYCSYTISAYHLILLNLAKKLI